MVGADKPRAPKDDEHGDEMSQFRKKVLKAATCRCQKYGIRNKCLTDRIYGRIGDY